MPQVTAEQARVAQTLTSWFNNLDEAARVDALCAVPWSDVVAQWADATGASAADSSTAEDLVSDGVIEVEDGRFLRTRAWS